MDTRDDARPRPGPLRRWLARACAAFGVCVAAWLVFGLLWRHDPADASRLGGWLAFASLCSQTFAFHAGLVVLLAGLVALAARARRTAVLLVLLLVPTLGSRAITHLPSARGASDAPGLTVFSANLLYGRADEANLLAQIEAADPDLVLFQEYTPLSASYELRLRDRYPHRVVLPREDAFGQAVFSRVPFTREPEVWRGPPGSVIPLIACEIDSDAGRVAVWNVHTLPPVGWRNTVAQRAMVAWIAERTRATMSGPDAPDGLIIAGDFNAPYATNHLRELRHAGLREAHRDAGVGPGATWPRLWWKRHFPNIRLDHAMHAGSLRAAHASVGDDCGSDHRPVIARFVRDAR